MKRSLQTRLTRGWNRLAFLFRRERLYRELAEEIEVHAHLKADENRRANLTPQDAVALSRRQLGNITFAKEECRNMWSFIWVERILQDLRFAGRAFGKTPVFTAIAVISLALGIGSNAAMFSLVDTLLLRPLPYSNPDSLVRVTGVFPRAALSFFKQQSRTLNLAGVSPGSELNLTGQGQPIRAVASFVSADFLSVLGVTVSRGRGFKAGEDSPGSDGVAIISTALWKDRFASDPAIIGRILTVNGFNREIIGVMPSQFSYPSSRVQLWIPMRLDPANFLEYWAGEFVPIVARLNPQVSLASAHDELRSLIPQFRKTFPYPMGRD